MRLRSLCFPAALLLPACGGETSVALDADSDGWTEGTDCNDQDPAIHPAADEICDGLENNCDGIVDIAVSGAPTWFADADSDGHGSLTIQLAACLPPLGFVSVADDCDDGDPAVFPGQPEQCDGADNDCDPATAASGGEEDGDLDHVLGCEDCDDNESAASPLRDEICDGIDNDCDGETDEDSALDAVTWYGDADGDGFGNEDVSQTSCEGIPGGVLVPGDCADLDNDRNPGAVEACDGLDGDCDGIVPTEEVDSDADGNAPCDGDCDDDDATRHSAAVELCNDLDDDCDSVVDDNAVGQVTVYADSDSDLWGGPVSVLRCAAGGGFVLQSGDCDEGDNTVHPGAPEGCDGLDTDCSAGPDSAEIDTDADGDAPCEGDCAEGNALIGPSMPELCNGTDDNCDSVPGGDESDLDNDGAAPCDGDCDDNDAARSPTAAEVCDTIDNDCDGVVDEGGISSPWFLDQDNDGFGDPSWTLDLCAPPTGWVADSTDCDDDDAQSFPAAAELCDGGDNDCDGAPDLDEVDLDGDLHFACADCLDTEATVHPGALEVCDGFDTDCDTVLPGEETDFDADSVPACADCDPGNGSTYPGAPELCNGLDDDCDTLPDDGLASPQTYYPDLDNDSYGDDTAAILACAPPPNHVLVDGDCNDNNNLSFPGGQEYCVDGDDNDCDGDVDCDDDFCSTGYPTCIVCGDFEVDSGEECDDGPPANGDGCDEFCQNEIDLSGLWATINSAGRDVYVFKSNPALPLSTWNDYCEDRGLPWYVPVSATDAQTVINQAYALDSHHTWIITKNTTTSGTWGGYSVSVDSPGCVSYSNVGFSAIRKWACSYCDPDNYNTTACWDSHSYDWLLCQEP